MIYWTALKLIARSWWKNKIFFFVSLLSLTVGIACTTLLATFVIHEYNIESSNPNSERILRLSQPALSGNSSDKTYYAYFPTDEPLLTAFPEIEKVLRIGNLPIKSLQVEAAAYEVPSMLSVDTLFLDFFPLESRSGDIKRTLADPQQVAVSEAYAYKLFGDKDPLGKLLEVNMDGSLWGIKKDTIISLRVGAVYKQRSHAMVDAELITSLSDAFGRSTIWLLLHAGTDVPSFRTRLEKTELQQLAGKGYYTSSSLKESYFDTHTSDPCDTLQSVVHHRDRMMLYTGLLAALLILFIGEFNYINLSFSRLMNQVRCIYIERLMGARQRFIRIQLLMDALSIFLLACLFSLLLMNDLLPVFNRLYESQLSLSYLFSWEALPVVLVLALLFCILPAIYASQRIGHLKESSFRQHFTGNKRQRTIALLVSLQFFISFVLFFALMTIRSQINLTYERAKIYEGVYRFCAPQGISMRPITNRTAVIPGVENISVTSGNESLLGVPYTNQVTGKEDYRMIARVEADPVYLPLLKAETIAESKTKSAHLAYVNQTFVKQFIKEGESPLNQSLGKLINLREYDSYTIVKVIRDYPSFHSLETPIVACFYIIKPDIEGQCLLMKCDKDKKAQIEKQLYRIGEQYQPGIKFIWEDLHDSCIQNNRDIFSFADLLLMYTVISLILIGIGLFGISWYAVRQRTKEIAIRKVHGAGTWKMIWLLNRPFIYQMLVAYVLAVPVAYGLTQRWLEQFAYRAETGVYNYLLPLLMICMVSLITVTLHTFLAVHASPVKSLKAE